MGRDIAPSFTGEWVEIIPDITIDGWSNLADPNPVTFEVHPLTAREFAAQKRQFMQASGKLERADELMRETLTNRVRNVRHYRVRGRDVQTGFDFAEQAESEFQTAAFNAIVDVSQLDAALKKTLIWQSGSSCQSPRRSAGDVMAPAAGGLT